MTSSLHHTHRGNVIRNLFVLFCNFVMVRLHMSFQFVRLLSTLKCESRIFWYHCTAVTDE